MPNEVRIDIDGQIVVMRLVSKNGEGWDYALCDDDNATEIDH